jgi:hypothetical protein
MQKTENSKENTPYWFNKWDTINSTFHSKIYCKSGKILPGYSKGINSREDPDKIICLQKWIKRLFNSKKGYFNPENVERIEVYIKGFLEKDNQLIFTLYHNTYKMEFNDKYSMNERLINFLKSFYREIEFKTYNIDKLIGKPIRISEEKMFDSNIKRFKDEIELMDFIIIKRKEGFEPGLLLGFANKYREKWF